jgi:PDZ domain-containing secreted protein
LNLPLKSTILISSVETGMPADGVLEPGDVILSVDGVDITSDRQSIGLIRKPPVGRVVHMSVLRKGLVKNVQMKTVSHPENPKWPFVGISVDTKYESTFNIDFGVNDVGGPSGGTMFALSIIDKLTPGALANGKIIAGTGTITPEGEVGAIGGIAQKMIASADHGAALFIAPKSNCQDINGHVPVGLKVVPVKTLTQAVQVLKDFKAKKPLASCPVKSKK